MEQALRSLSLAVSFGVGAVVALVGAFRGMPIQELAPVVGITIASLFILVRLIAGHYAGVITRRLAETRAARAARHLLDP